MEAMSVYQAEREGERESVRGGGRDFKCDHFASLSTLPPEIEREKKATLMQYARRFQDRSRAAPAETLICQKQNESPPGERESSLPKVYSIHLYILYTYALYMEPGARAVTHYLS